MSTFNIAKEWEPLKKKVGSVLADNQETRSNDNLLWVEVLKRFYVNRNEVGNIIHNTSAVFTSTKSGEEYIRVNELNHVPSRDDVSRKRRAFNQHSKYLSSNLEVLIARAQLERACRSLAREDSNYDVFHAKLNELKARDVGYKDRTEAPDDSD